MDDLQEKEQLQLLRESFVKGYVESYRNQVGLSKHVPVGSDLYAHARERALKEYPDPPQPREIIFEALAYRYVDNRIECRWLAERDGWKRADATPEYIRALHDLLERPNAS